jgi:pimeloyl-ACP methyl ester carboxylesterase
MTVQPFTINIQQGVLDDLWARLARTRWPDQIEGAGWEYGTNLEYLRELVSYWQNQYDWRTQEAALNQFAHFRTEIDGYGLHFIHERGKGPKPLPLILTHGWPDSFYRMIKIIPMLTDPARFGGDPADAFDVVVPSIPGYGFSDRPKQAGSSNKTSGRFVRLMTEELGYARFGAHGGDNGSPISQEMALLRPDAVIGLHLTDVGWGVAMTLDYATLSEAEQAYLNGTGQWFQAEGAYAMIQGTKPQSLAYGLNDSPAGLAAWIVEKFRMWSDSDGDVEKRFTKDELLTNIMIYWATETISSSIRGYYEGMHEAPVLTGERINVPTGLAVFPKDNPPPRALAERMFDLRHFTEMPRGGHFAALEEPELLVQDIRAFYRGLRG